MFLFFVSSEGGDRPVCPQTSPADVVTLFLSFVIGDYRMGLKGDFALVIAGVDVLCSIFAETCVRHYDTVDTLKISS